MSLFWCENDVLCLVRKRFKIWFLKEVLVRKRHNFEHETKVVFILVRNRFKIWCKNVDFI